MARNYPNMVDYVRTQLDTFAQRDVCRVDSLVFSWLSYFRLPEDAVALLGDEGMALKELYRAEWFEPMCGTLYDAESSVELLTAMAASPRFRDVRVSGYVSRVNERAEQQFSAMTLHLYPRATFVAFRGTDNTLVGWKEDFNMAFQTAVPSQVAAVRYLERVAERTEGRLWCGGHSKGGNLAAYAGRMCLPTTQARVVACFSHDGPGFSEETMSDPRWSNSAVRIDKTIPQSSVVGMIFERQERNYTVVHSHSLGFTQHDPLSWEVDWRDFKVDERMGAGASVLDSSMNDWLAKTSRDERERFVDTVFSVLGSAGVKTMGDIRKNWRTVLPKMLTSVAELDPQDRQLVLTAIGDVARTMVPAFPQLNLAAEPAASESSGTQA